MEARADYQALQPRSDAEGPVTGVARRSARRGQRSGRSCPEGTDLQILETRSLRSTRRSFCALFLPRLLNHCRQPLKLCSGYLEVAVRQECLHRLLKTAAEEVR